MVWLTSFQVGQNDRECLVSQWAPLLLRLPPGPTPQSPLQTGDGSSQWNMGRKNTSYFLIWPWEIFWEILLMFSLPISFGKGGPQVLEEGMAIRQEEPGFLNKVVEQTSFPPNSHHQIQNKLYYTKPLKQWDLGSITTNKASGGDEFQLNISNPKRWCCESAALNMPANLENSAVAMVKKISFHSIPKKGNDKECSSCHTIAFISHARK